MNDILRRGKKVGTAVAGGFVILLGLILIPYPGPGWLVVFAGFAILATEFAFAGRALARLKGKYEQWKVWLKQQPLLLRVLVLGFTGLVILLTAWLLNTFGLIDTLLHLGQDWLYSPILGKQL